MYRCVCFAAVKKYVIIVEYLYIYLSSACAIIHGHRSHAEMTQVQMLTMQHTEWASSKSMKEWSCWSPMKYTSLNGSSTLMVTVVSTSMCFMTKTVADH